MSSNIFNEEWHEEWKQREFLRRKEELINFYKDYLGSTEVTEKFIINIYDRTSLEDNIMLRMMNNIKRFSTIMDDIQNKFEIKLFFLIVCIESIYKLANDKSCENNRGILKDFLNNYLIEPEKEWLMTKITHSIADNRYITGDRHLNLDDISDLLNEIRNKLVHEGVYGYFNFGSEECPNINVINLFEGEEIKEAREEIKEIKKNKGVKIDLDEYKRLEKYERTYEISITYDELKNVLVKGMIRFLKSRLE